MNAKATITNDLVQLIHANLTTVLLFECAARHESAVVDRKDQGLE